MAYTIYPYGTNNRYTAKSVNDNISSIMSRMVCGTRQKQLSA